MRNNNRPVNGAGKDSDSSDKISIDPVKLIKIVTGRWYIVALSAAVCFAIGYVYAKSAERKFLSEAVMRFDSKSQESKFSTSKMLSGGNESSDYMAEVYSIKSTPVIKEALDSLGTHFYFTAAQGLRNVNIYPAKPFESKIVNYDIDLFQGGAFTLTNEGKNFDLRYKHKELKIDTLYKNVKEGSVIKVPGLTFSIEEKISVPFKKVNFTFIDYWAMKGLSDKVVIKEADRNMPVLRATFNSDNGTFTRDFLKTLLTTYFDFDIQAKKRSSEQTLSFIELQLAAFEGLMRTSSTNLQNIKQRYDLLDVSATSSQYMSTVADLRTRKLNLEIQGKNFDLVTENIKNNKDVVANVVGWDGVPDPFLSEMLQELNVKMAQKKQSMINFSEESVVVRNLTEDIATLKRKIIENIALQRRKSEQAYKAYDEQLNELNKDLRRMPSAERDLIYTTSDVDVNKNIYTLLLNKKLETAIDKAAQTPSFSMIEVPRVAVQTAPFEPLIMVVAGLIGLVLGVVIVFLKRFFNSKFTDIGGISKMDGVSMLGIVNHYKEHKDLDEASLKRIHENDSAFAESINSIRTNLLFQANAGPGSVIAISSATAGEGKSFVSLNIAVALTRIDKTVLLVATDLRRSKMHQYFNVSNETGLSTYLETEKTALSQVIKKSTITGLDFISSGPVPNNPSELILKARFWEMLESLERQYDFIILDTAPVGMVSDSLPILKKASLNIFVVRWLYSNKEAASVAEMLSQEHQLDNVSVIVNDYAPDSLYDTLDNSYGMHYGAAGYYGEDSGQRKTLWKRIAKP